MILIQRQLELLWQNILDDVGKPKTVTEVAKATGVTEQSLLNLLHGRTHDPRLATLQRLCLCFGISLDYFGLTSEAACLGYLAKCGKLGAAPDVLQRIDAQAYALSPRMTHDVLVMLQWRLLGAKS